MDKELQDSKTPRSESNKQNNKQSNTFSSPELYRAVTRAELNGDGSN